MAEYRNRQFIRSAVSCFLFTTFGLVYTSNRHHDTFTTRKCCMRVSIYLPIQKRKTPKPHRTNAITLIDGPERL